MSFGDTLSGSKGGRLNTNANSFIVVVLEILIKNKYLLLVILCVLCMCSNLIGTAWCTKGNIETVPAIDSIDSQGQINQFSFFKLGNRFIIDIIRNIPIVDPCYCFSPGKCCPL